MEFTELQALWQQHDKSLAENTRINKEILKRILISKPEKRINREKIKTGISLILPSVLILLVLIPNIHYRSSVDFYIGISMFGAVFSIVYFWSVRYFMLLFTIDFASPIILIKKKIKQLEKYKIKHKKVGFIPMPFALTGVFLMNKMPIFSKESILPLFLVVLVMLASIYYTFKYSIFEQFRKLDMEIEELEKLEIE